MSEEKSLFERLGGRPCLEKVHKIFYDKIYAHPWLKLFFQTVEQKVQETQATDFMTEPMGGGSIYSGKFPIPAHSHMYITEELFELRHKLLKESLQEAGVPLDLQEPWLRIDQAFKRGLVKNSIEECKPRYTNEPIMAFKNPLKESV